MRRVLAWTVVPVATGLFLWATAPSSASAPRADSPEAAACKPEAPILVTLQTDGDGAGTRAAFAIRPVLELSEVRWSWELDPDVRLVEGEAQGSAEPARGVLTERQASFAMPDDGRHHTARLVVTGLLAHDSEDDGAPEPVTVVRTLSWGEPEPVAPLVWTPDETGQLVRVASVPTTHEPASPARPGGR